jgi:hypothetical protein
VGYGAKNAPNPRYENRFEIESLTEAITGPQHVMAITFDGSKECEFAHRVSAIRKGT